MKNKSFVCYFWFVSWSCIAAGISLCLSPPHLQIHLPFGFINIGLAYKYSRLPINENEVAWRCHGIKEKPL